MFHVGVDRVVQQLLVRCVRVCVLLATRIVLCNYELGRGRDEIMLVIVLEVCEHDKPVRVFDAASGTTTWVMKEHNTLRMR